ncbi:hypothetical protein D1007_41916 [Hordeum vulgare]|nr:hypothetical protein D1007_41916 [Hordeum vulgare]
MYGNLVPSLVAKVGEVIYVEPQSQDFEGNFHRAWVRINVNKPLKNVVSLIRGGQRKIYRVKFEKLPDWCAVCGVLGHLYKEHGNGIHPPSSLVFKDLKASCNMRVGQGPGGGRGQRGGRRGGRSGRGEDPSSDPEKNEVGEKDSCPADDEYMVEADSNMKISITI